MLKTNLSKGGAQRVYGNHRKPRAIPTKEGSGSRTVATDHSVRKEEIAERTPISFPEDGSRKRGMGLREVRRENIGNSNRRIEESASAKGKIS